MSDTQRFAIRPRISVPVENPDDPAYISLPGAGLDGVVGIGSDGVIGCSGALLWTGRHILTVAHCFDIEEGIPNPNPNPAEVTVFFDLPTGQVGVPVSRIFQHPNWIADVERNNDIAIIELAQMAPEAADRYDIYTASDEVGQPILRVGFGLKATGNTGQLTDDNPIRRFGLNRYEGLGEILSAIGYGNVIPGTQLVYDFDSGLPQNDGLGVDFGLADLGFGFKEVGSSNGDSGGPSFIGNKIAGIVSNGISSSVDVTPGNDTSFGEIFTDTRISAYAGYIAETIALSNSGDDAISGTNRNDNLNGNRGNDRIDGGGGNDILFGGQDNDVLIGNLGNDVLSGDFGQDTLIGSEGSDTFVLRTDTAVADPNQADIIADFNALEDAIGLTAGLTEANLSLEAFVIGETPGILLRVANTGDVLGFVSNATTDQLSGRFVAA